MQTDCANIDSKGSSMTLKRKLDVVDWRWLVHCPFKKFRCGRSERVWLFAYISKLGDVAVVVECWVETKWKRKGDREIAHIEISTKATFHKAFRFRNQAKRSHLLVRKEITKELFKSTMDARFRYGCGVARRLYIGSSSSAGIFTRTTGGSRRACLVFQWTYII